MRRIILLLVLCCGLGAAAVVPAGAQGTSGTAQEIDGPIKHLVVVVEQNSTFDHTFGTLQGVEGAAPGIDGTKVGAPIPQEGGNKKVRAFSSLSGSDLYNVPEGQAILANDPVTAQTAWNNDAMDRFAQAQENAGKSPHLPFVVIDQDAPSPWAQLAARGVIFDKYFSSYLAGSLPNTLSLVSGSADGRTVGNSSDLTSLWRARRVRTIFDVVDKNANPAVTWGYYVGGLESIDPTKIADQEYVESRLATPSQLYWAPILAMHRFWSGSAPVDGVRTQSDFFVDAAHGKLPSITYVLPQPVTHEPEVLSPDLRLLTIVNALQTSPDWSSTAVLVVWDDWGGYYDHVHPPEANDGHQLGMRVPALLISPFAKPGSVNHAVLDHSSVPALAASLFDLPWRAAPMSNPFPVRVLENAPDDQTSIEALDYAPRYEAAGLSHARTVFTMYLLTLLAIAGVLGVLGFSVLRRTSWRGSGS